MLSVENVKKVESSRGKMDWNEKNPLPLLFVSVIILGIGVLITFMGGEPSATGMAVVETPIQVEPEIESEESVEIQELTPSCVTRLMNAEEEFSEASELLAKEQSAYNELSEQLLVAERNVAEARAALIEAEKELVLVQGRCS